MATYRVLHSATGAADGSTWADAYTTLAAALAVATSADQIWVGHDHAETQASANTLTFPTSIGLLVLCVTRSGASGNSGLATTGSLTTTGANRLSLNSGYAYIYGLIFNGGTSAQSGGSLAVANNSTLATHLILEACSFISPTNSSFNVITIVAAGSTNTNTRMVELIDPRFKFAHASQGITAGTAGGILKMRRGTAAAAPLLISGGTVPTTLFIGQAYRQVEISGLDLSDFGSGNNLFTAPTATTTLLADVRDCKLGSSVSLITGSWGGPQSGYVRMHNCDSADTNYRFAESSFAGTVVQETTIVRTGGASDGTTPISVKATTSASALLSVPLLAFEGVVWNETTGSAITLTVEGISDGYTPTDAEAWVEVEHLGTSGVPLAVLDLDDRVVDVLATPAAQASSSETWTTTGLTTPTKWKLVSTFTPAEKGLIRYRVMFAKASSTAYFDRMATLS